MGERADILSAPLMLPSALDGPAHFHKKPIGCLFLWYMGIFCGVGSLKVEPSYMVYKTFYRMILSSFKQIWHLDVDVGNKVLMKSVSKKSSFLWFCRFFTYLAAMGKLFDQYSPYFQEICNIYGSRYAESLRSYFPIQRLQEIF